MLRVITYYVVGLGVQVEALELRRPERDGKPPMRLYGVLT